MGELSFASAKTLANRRPVVDIPQQTPVRLSEKESYDLVIPVSDPDGHQWQAKFVGSTYGASMEPIKDGIRLHLLGQNPVGKYQITIKVIDELGASEEVILPFEVYQNRAPKQQRPLVRHYLPLGREALKFDLRDIFVDMDNEVLTYKVRVIGTSTVEASISDGVLSIIGKQIGLSGLEVSATDPKGLTARATLEIEVVKDELVHLVYPIPASTTLNIRLADRLREAVLRIFTPVGQQMLSKSVTLGQGEQVAQLDIRSLTTGTYILQVEAEGKTFRQSFIKR